MTSPQTPWTALRDSRLAAGLNQAGLAALIGSAQALVSRLETGDTLPSNGTYQDLRAVLPGLTPPTVNYDNPDTAAELDATATSPNGEAA